MEQKSDTQALVQQTADALLYEGIRPTQQNVRERIGSGSITTINKALNAWWQALGERLKTNTSHPMLPDPVAESASKLWHQAVAYADARLEKERLDLESIYQAKAAAFDELEQKDEQELKQLRQQCLTLLQDKERLSNEKYTCLKQISDLENQLLRSGSELEALKRELKQQGAMTGRSDGSDSIEAFIEQQVTNRFLKEENKNLKKQLDAAINENAALKYELTKLHQHTEK